MAKKGKVKATESPDSDFRKAMLMIIQAEQTNLETLVVMRNRMTDMCVNTKNALVIFGKMAGEDTTELELLKVE